MTIVLSVSWCFQPSQPQRITSGLNTNFTLSLLVGAFSPVNHDYIRAEHKTSLYLQVIHSTSHYTASLFFFFFFLFSLSNHSSNYIYNFGTQNQKKRRKKTTYFGAYLILYSVSIQHGNLNPAGWPISFCGPTQEPVLATANTGKTRERFWKKCRWMDRKGRN